MLYQHNHSTLLGEKRRSVYYPPTGSGRDTYIINNNGGTNIKYTSQGVPQLGNYMKFGPINKSYKPQSYTRFHKYTSDGTGRDNYVVSKHGGQYLEEDTINSKLVKFRKTMRDGGEWKNIAQITTQSWRTQSVMKKQDQMNRTQRALTGRLSMPKFTNKKYEEQLMNLKQQFEKTSQRLKPIEINNQEIQF